MRKLGLQLLAVLLGVVLGASVGIVAGSVLSPNGATNHRLTESISAATTSTTSAPAEPTNSDIVTPRHSTSARATCGREGSRTNGWLGAKPESITCTCPRIPERRSSPFRFPSERRRSRAVRSSRTVRSRRPRPVQKQGPTPS